MERAGSQPSSVPSQMRKFTLFVLIVFSVLGIAASSYAQITNFGVFVNRFDSLSVYGTNPMRFPYWEATHFDYIIASAVKNLWPEYKQANPNVRIYQYMTPISAVENEGYYDSMLAYIGRESLDTQHFFCHYALNSIVSPGAASYDIRCVPAWVDSNDQNSDKTRDWTSVFGMATSYNASTVTDTTKAWTTNEWVGYGLYDFYGTFLD